MLYYKCKCGEIQIYGSMPPDPCLECDDCLTTPETHSHLHKRAEPHKWTTEVVVTDSCDGMLTFCEWCRINKKDYENVN